MESRNYCAYNETRECFLGLQVAAADIPYAGFKDMISTLSLKSGEGLWFAPFRGIPEETGMCGLLDLVYLDEDSRVIEVVESFPTFRVTPSSSPAATVLALPIHSIYSSQTQQGDQLVLCVAEEMERRLERSSGSCVDAETIQSAVLLRETPLWSGGPGVLQLEDRSSEERPQAPQKHEMDLIQPGTKSANLPKNWLERWWSPDPRKAPRDAAPGLAAYYWTGGVLEPHNIRDISQTGLYLVTEERWYPGTLVLMTLTATGEGEETATHSISVQTRAVRWGNDGVGLQFVLANGKNLRQLANGTTEAIDKKDLDRFLRQLRKGKE